MGNNKRYVRLYDEVFVECDNMGNPIKFCKKYGSILSRKWRMFKWRTVFHRLSDYCRKCEKFRSASYHYKKE